MGNTEILKPATKEFALGAKTPPKDVPAEAQEAEAPIEPQNAGREIPAPPANDPRAALAARMERFKALQATKLSIKANFKEEVSQDITPAQQKELDDKLKKDKSAGGHATMKIFRDTLGPEKFERKRAMDYTSAEAEQWDKGQRKKQKNRDNVAFSDWQAEAHKNYKRQLKNLGKVDLNAYLAEKAQKLQNQVSSGLLELVETDDGEIFTVDKQGRINTPVDEAYIHGDHKPSKDAVDRLVADLDKAERARLKARAARGMDDDDKGDVTYINQKNKQFNDKLARFYNRYTTEIRESFERGTAI